MRPFNSWGRLSHEPHDVQVLHSPGEAVAALQASTSGRPGLPLGQARSYGDVCLNPHGRLWSTAGLDRFMHFDAALGRLRCEAGVTLAQIQHRFAPRGWRLPVTPGTLQVSVGGAIANDVHGKNHQLHGSFGHHVLQLQLQRSDGQLIDCSRTQHADWLAATVGGLGLTGLITSAELQLVPSCGPWLASETLAFGSLQEFLQIDDATQAEGAAAPHPDPDGSAPQPSIVWEHTVAWLDLSARGGCRGLYMRAKPLPSGPQAPALAGRPRKPRRVPFTTPMSLVNGLTLPLLNSAYFHAKRRGPAVVQADKFLYPLDAVEGWNRLYGPRGFYQHQCVVPRDAAVLAALLREIGRSGQGSMLNVLKTLGPRGGAGLLSFARPGLTLAVDLANRGERTLALLAKLEAIVAEAGGRLYPAKDASMSRASFERGYPRLPEFLPYRDGGISSAMSRRLMGA